MSNFDFKPEGFFDGDQATEQVAREKQAEVDADIKDSQEVGRRLTEQREIKETNDRMTKIFNLVSRLMNKKENGQDNVNFNFQFEGENLVLEILGLRKGAQEGSSAGTNNKDIVRIIIAKPLSEWKKEAIHDLTLMRKFGNDNFEVQYRDSTQEIRKPKAYGEDGNPNFGAETALKELPELADIEKMVERVVENNK